MNAVNGYIKRKHNLGGWKKRSKNIQAVFKAKKDGDNLRRLYCRKGISELIGKKVLN